MDLDETTGFKKMEVVLERKILSGIGAQKHRGLKK
jgi:hypothetical protein